MQEAILVVLAHESASRNSVTARSSRSSKSSAAPHRAPARTPVDARDLLVHGVRSHRAWKSRASSSSFLAALIACAARLGVRRSRRCPRRGSRCGWPRGGPPRRRWCTRRESQSPRLRDAETRTQRVERAEHIPRMLSPINCSTEHASRAPPCSEGDRADLVGTHAPGRDHVGDPMGEHAVFRCRRRQR